MADTLDQFIRTIKVFYEQKLNMLQGGKQGIDQLLFGVDDMDESANFAIDSLVRNPYAISFRKRGEQSHVRPYTAGTGNIYEVPRASEKTPITEYLRDSVVAGIESTSGWVTHNGRLIKQIVDEHVAAHTVTRWKLAIDTIRTGSFTPLGIGGEDIGEEIDFSRDATCEVTYDFTAAGSTIDFALKEMYDAMRANGAGISNLCVILGARWQQELEIDSDVLEKMQANTANQVISLNMMPPELNNTQDLYVIGRYRPSGVVAPIWILAYVPTQKYVAYNGATAAEFMPEDEAIMFGLGDQRYRVFRGVDALSDNGMVTRAVGEIVFDSYTEKDPISEFVRSQTRIAMVPGNVNHTVRSSGQFEQES